MSKKMIITIGREYGSGGFEIGKKLADELGIAFYDKNLIGLAAKESGMNPDLLAVNDEKVPGMIFDPSIDSLSEKLFAAQSEVIRKLADKESCVIVGRCANSVLKDRDDVLKVFIHAPLQDRITRVKDAYLQCPEDKAKKEITRVDKNRRSYYQYYTGYKWGGLEHTDLHMNSSLFGINGTVKLLAQIVREKSTE